MDIYKVKHISGAEFCGYEEVFNFMLFYMRDIILDYFDVERADGEVDMYRLKAYALEESLWVTKTTLKYEMLQENKTLKMTIECVDRFKWYIDDISVWDIYDINDEIDEDLAIKCYANIQKELELGIIKSIENRHFYSLKNV